MSDQEYISHLKSHIRSQDSLLAKQAEQLMIQAGKIEQLEKKVLVHDKNEQNGDCQ